MFFPTPGQRITVGIAAGPSEHEWSAFGNCEIRSGADDWRAVGCSGDRIACAARAAGDEGLNLFQAPRMKIGIAVKLEIIAAADAGVRHDCRTAAGFECARSAAIATATRHATVEGMSCAELMTDLVRDVIDPKRVADGRVKAGFAVSFAAGNTGNSDTSEAPPRRAEDVANVVIRIADYKIEVRLILRDEQARIIGRVRVIV